MELSLPPLDLTAHPDDVTAVPPGGTAFTHGIISSHGDSRPNCSRLNDSGGKDSESVQLVSGELLGAHSFAALPECLLTRLNIV